MDFTGEGGFWALPFPSDARADEDGAVHLAAFPNPSHNDLVNRVITILTEDNRGFGTTSGIFFQLSRAIPGDALPDIHQGVAEGSTIVLLGADPAAPDYLKRYPISARLLEDGGPFGAPNLLSILPLQGVPLRPKTRYAAIVLRDFRGVRLDRSFEMDQLAGGERPEGMSEAAFASAMAGVAAAKEAGISIDEVAALTTFTTGDPTAALARVTEAMLQSPLPAPSKPFVRNEVFDDYCVYETTISMPVYQEGEPPYTETGGRWAFDASGKPLLQRMEEANFVVTVPRAKMPDAGYPLVVFSRTGGGGERPLVDRGVRATPGGEAITPGTGPALYFAGAGFAGASVDGPHGGLRNITKADEQFLVFNFSNPVALRDNVRQSAAELALLAHVVEPIEIDVADCQGADAPGGKAHFDVTKLALMGHSMGAAIAPLTLAVEPRYRAVLMSGAGGSFIENLIHKEKPIAVKPLAEVLLGLNGTGYELSEYDPLLSMLQWAGEAADVPPYADAVIRHRPANAGAPPHVLMMQGIVDTYILPPIANATSLSFGLDLAGEELDDDNEALAKFTPLGELLPLVGRGVIALPAAANVESPAGTVTAVVTQHPEDGVENGHEAVFQTEPPKHEYRCFLEGLAKGAPRVPSAGEAFDPCD